MKNLIYENSRKAIDQDEYNQKYDSYTNRHKKIKSEISKLEEKNYLCSWRTYEKLAL